MKTKFDEYLEMVLAYIKLEVESHDKMKAFIDENYEELMTNEIFAKCYGAITLTGACIDEMRNWTKEDILEQFKENI